MKRDTREKRTQPFQCALRITEIDHRGEEIDTKMIKTVYCMDFLYF